jgi:hypothetical protein
MNLGSKVRLTGVPDDLPTDTRIYLPGRLSRCAWAMNS